MKNEEIRQMVRDRFDQDERRWKREALVTMLTGGFTAVGVFSLLWSFLEPLASPIPVVRVMWSLLAVGGGLLAGMGVGLVVARLMKR